MHKFNVNDHIVLEKSKYAGELGIITSIVFVGDYESEPRYLIRTESKPEGYTVPESYIELVCTKQEEKRFEELQKINHMFFDFAAVPYGFDRTKLAIYGGEGMIPHFHFFKDNPIDRGIINTRKEGCICILEPYYFLHGAHQEMMNNQEIKSLKKFLNTKCRNPGKCGDMTVWEYIINKWNTNNPNQTQIPKGHKIPDYKSDMPNITDKKKDIKE